MANNKFGFWVLTALVVGNMVGSGIFMLPRTLAEVASPAGVLSAWVLTGFGVLMLALVFGNLSLRKPELSGGPQIYAKAIFKEGSKGSTFLGYLVSWGYWVSNWSGNVAIITTFASYLSTFFPIMTSKAPLWQIGGLTLRVGHVITFFVCTALLWAIHYLILRGVEGAGKASFVATAAKVVGFIFFIIVCLFVFQVSNMVPFATQVTGNGGQSFGLLGQVNHAAVATLWAFVGIESAVVFSSRARNKSDVKKATSFGLFLTLIIYMGITVLVMGTLTRGELLSSQKPLVDALSISVGSSSAYILAALALISLTGTTIGWVLLSAEVPYQAAKQGIFPRKFATENKKGAPTFALVLSNVLAQAFLFSTISGSIAHAFQFVIMIATLTYLVPYLVSAIFQLKLVFEGDTYLGQPRARTIDGIIAGLAAIYSLWVIKAGTSDLKTFLLGLGLFAVGIVFYPLVPKAKKLKER
ncbi:MAG TPA: amino acid permease [Bacillales bacterium]|nr:amino acid permease [Bacillales bacterium]